MAAQNGRGFLIKMDISSTPTTIGGSKSGSIKLNNEPIDITSKTSAGVRQLLEEADAGLLSAEISLSGVNLDDSTIGAVRTQFMSQTAEGFTVVIPGSTGGSAGSYTFEGIITSLEETGEEGGALSYSITIMSSGAITFTDLT